MIKTIMKKQVYAFITMIMLLITTSSSAQEAKKFVYTPQGVDAIKLGATFNQLPKAVAGLYDKAEVKKEYDEMEGMDLVEYVFTLKGEKVVVAQVDNNKIYSINIYGSNIATPGGINPGMTIATLLAQKGVKQITDNYGNVYYQQGKYLIIFGEGALNASGAKKVENAYMKDTDANLTINDYNKGAKVFTILYAAQ